MITCSKQEMFVWNAYAVATVLRGVPSNLVVAARQVQGSFVTNSIILHSNTLAQALLDF